MNHLLSIENKIALFKDKPSLIKEGMHGLEKENLRVTSKGLLSDKDHPKALGSPLTHPSLNLDFAEAQLEFVTKAHENIGQAFQELITLHQFVYQQIGTESLWPHSCPCPVDDIQSIRLATFAATKEGHQKEIYRRGLSYRYGKTMQLLSGIHYSFSFSHPFWQFFHQSAQSDLNLPAFISENYLALCRNFLRLGWICSYLFGATPCLDRSYFKHIEKPFVPYLNQSCIAPYATSLRMSKLGYHSKEQSQLFISLNSLKEHIHDLTYALKTPHPFFQKIGTWKNGQQLQLSENFLQLEAEYYSRIRPKPYASIQSRPIEALKNGVGYIEARNIDINPFESMGMDIEMLYFYHLFFVYCLFKESPPILPDEAKVICENQNSVALFGRKKKLELIYNQEQPLLMKDWMELILNEMAPIATLFDQSGKGDRYTKALNMQKKKMADCDLTPSAQQLHFIMNKKQEFDEFVFEKGQTYRHYFLQKKLISSMTKQFKQIAIDSLKQAKDQENEQALLSGYEDMELSTQMIIHEAFLRKIEVEILDRKENFICLHHQKKKIFLKQATLTDKDTILSYMLMQNKYVTQRVLKEEKLATSDGSLFADAKAAIEAYSQFENKQIVLKPNTANYGLGLFFIDPNQKEEFTLAAKHIEVMGDQILVEDFFKGEEYRFLVIDHKVAAVCKRVPAYVEGDGHKTIEELVVQKNKHKKIGHPLQRKIELNKEAEKYLADQGFQKDKILAKGKLAYLRKNSNISTGGESVDATDDVIKAYKQIAANAAKAVNASFCGVDILIQDVKAKPTKDNHLIIELNYNPALFIHRFPSKGQPRMVEKQALDFLLK